MVEGQTSTGNLMVSCPNLEPRILSNYWFNQSTNKLTEAVRQCLVNKNCLHTCTYIFQFETHEWGSKRPPKFYRSLKLPEPAVICGGVFSSPFEWMFCGTHLSYYRSESFLIFDKKYIDTFIIWPNISFGASWVWAKQSEIELEYF